MITLVLLFGIIILIGILVIAGAVALVELPVLLLIISDVVIVVCIIKAIFKKKDVEVIEERKS